MMNRVGCALVLAILPLAISCSEGTYECTPSGSEITITVVPPEFFDTKCLAVRAGAATSLTLENHSSITHNVALYQEEPRGGAFAGQNEADLDPPNLVFRTDDVRDATETFELPPLVAGELIFQCDYHPSTMYGTFHVGSAEPS